MPSVEVTFQTDKALAETVKHLKASMGRAGLGLVRHCADNLRNKGSKDNLPPKKTYARKKKGFQLGSLPWEGKAKRKRQRRVAPHYPSAVGDYPAKDRGILGRNIAFDVKSRVTGSMPGVVLFFGVRKGEADKYARRLEYGFYGTDSKGRNVHQGPRPFIRASVWALKNWLVETMGK